MTYAIVFLHVFQKQFRRMPAEMERRVRAWIKELAENPYLDLRLVGVLEVYELAPSRCTAYTKMNKF